MIDRTGIKRRPTPNPSLKGGEFKISSILVMWKMMVWKTVLSPLFLGRKMMFWKAFLSPLPFREGAGG